MCEGVKQLIKSKYNLLSEDYRFIDNDKEV